MAQTKQFELIVRRVKKNIIPLRAAEKRIIIDNYTGKAVEKSSIMGSYTYYIVTNSNDLRNVPFTSSVFPVVDDKNRKINLSVTCQISCDPGCESLAAEALHQQYEYPANTLDNLVETWLLEFVRQQSDPATFIDTFFQNRENLQLYLFERAKSQTGLNFYPVKCLLEGEAELGTIHITLKDVLLRYSDSVTEHPYSADISLLVDPNNKINAIARARTKSQFEAIVNRHLREYFFNQVSLADLYDNREGVESKFKAHLGAILRPYGRRIGAILLKTTTPPGVEEALRVTITVPIEVPEYSKRINVENQVLIKISDPAKYYANKQDDLKKWLEENVHRIVTDVYFGLRYDSIISDERKLKEEVEKILKSRVEGIGYSLDHFILIPALQELKILEKIEIEIDDEFITKDYQKVKLVVSIKARGDRYSSKIKEYINNIMTLPAGMKEAVLDEITKYLRQITAQYFYENFDNDQNPQAITVRGRLRRIISGKLKEVFDAQILFVSFDIGENEKIRKMEELKKGWHIFKVDIVSRTDFNTSSFSGWFRVQDNELGGWNIFQPQEFSINEITERICESLKSRLSAIASNRLAYQDPNQQINVENLIKKTALDAIKESFGIAIVMRDIRMTNGPADYVRAAINDLEKRIVLAIADGDYKIAGELSENLDFLKKRAGYKASLPAASEQPLIEAKPENKNGDGGEN
jgi:hypothetical protein